MATIETNTDIAKVRQLLHDYCFDVGDHNIDMAVVGWLQEFDLVWIGSAIVEALYQGRYKLISVEQILRFWQRRGQPLRHFNREFESIIIGSTCFTLEPPPVSSTPATSTPSAQADKRTGSDRYDTSTSSPPVANDQPDIPIPPSSSGDPAVNPLTLPALPPSQKNTSDASEIAASATSDTAELSMSEPSPTPANPFLMAAAEQSDEVEGSITDTETPDSASQDRAPRIEPPPLTPPPTTWVAATPSPPLPGSQRSTDTIPPFVPTPDSTDIYQRLQAVAHRPIQ